MSADVRGPWEFDKSLKYPLKRRGGPMFSSDVGDAEKAARMKKRAEVAAILDAAPRRKPATSSNVGQGPAKAFGTTPNASRPSMTQILGQERVARVVARVIHSKDADPGPEATITEQLAAARAKAGK